MRPAGPHTQLRRDGPPSVGGLWPRVPRLSLSGHSHPERRPSGQQAGRKPCGSWSRSTLPAGGSGRGQQEAGQAVLTACGRLSVPAHHVLPVTKWGSWCARGTGCGELLGGRGVCCPQSRACILHPIEKHHPRTSYREHSSGFLPPASPHPPALDVWANTGLPCPEASPWRPGQCSGTVSTRHLTLWGRRGQRSGVWERLSRAQVPTALTTACWLSGSLSELPPTCPRNTKCETQTGREIAIC